MHFIPLVFAMQFGLEQRIVEDDVVWSSSPRSALIQAVAFSPDGKYLLAGDLFGRVTLWDAASGRLVKRMASGFIVWMVGFSPDGRRAVATSGTRMGGEKSLGLITLWEIPSGRLIKRLHSRKDSGGMPFAFSPDSKQVLMSGEDGFALWDATTGSLGKRFKIGRTSDGHLWFRFRSDGKVVSLGIEAITIFDLKEKKRVRTIPIWKAPSPRGMVDVAWTPDARCLAFSTGASLHVVNTATGANRTIVPAPNDRWVGLNYVAISADGKRLLSAGRLGRPDGQIYYWEVATRGLVSAFPKGKAPSAASLTITDRPMDALALSPDGRWAVSGEGWHTLTLWDSVTGKILRTMSPFTGPPRPPGIEIIKPVGSSGK